MFVKEAATLEISRLFVCGTEFSRAWKWLGFSDDDQRRLENILLRNPKAGDVIRGTGRMRKLRFAFPYRGKKGSVRVCYVDFEECEILYLLAVFAKNEQENLTMAECNSLKKQIDRLEETLRGGNRNEQSL